MPESPGGFETGSALHLAVVAASALAVLALVRLARRAARRSPPAERALRIAWVAGIILLQGFTQVRSNLPGRFDAVSSLPLHICDLVPWIGAAALLSSRSWPRSLAYFWGFGLSGWAFILPVLTHGPGRIEFWLFWLGHGQIIGTAAYLVGVLGHRPSGRGFAQAAVATAVYSALILPYDLWFGADYGYLGRDSATERLGPWPLRIAPILAGEMAIFALLLLPWRRGPRGDPNGSGEGPAPREL